MPQIGWFELIIIVVIAVLVIGPKDFPIVIRKVGTWIGSIKRYFSDVQREVNQITDIEDDVTKKITREKLSEKLGGSERVKRQHISGRYTIRERIKLLTDKLSFHEIGKIAGQATYDENQEHCSPPWEPFN